MGKKLFLPLLPWLVLQNMSNLKIQEKESYLLGSDLVSKNVMKIEDQTFYHFSNFKKIFNIMDFIAATFSERRMQSDLLCISVQVQSWL